MMRQVLTFSLGLSFLVALGGCSVSDLDQSKSSDNVEVEKQKAIVTPKRVIPKKAPVKVVKPYKPEVRPYVDSKPTVSIPSDETQVSSNTAIVELEKSKTDEVADPYSSIPDSAVVTKSSPKITSTLGAPEERPAAKPRSSSAVKALMTQARAEMIIGKYSLAENKLERGLRIEAENPQLWSLMAKAHFGQSNYSQAINMARKAIQFSRNDDEISSNWELVKEAGEKSGDAIAVKDALDYIKMNP